MTSKRIKVKIKELGKVVGGATPSTRNPENWGGSIPWVTPKDLANHRERFIKKGEKSISQKGYDSCSTKMLPKGTVLFSSRAPIGYCAIAENDICTNQGFKSIIPNENTDSLFLYYLLKSNVDAIANNASGTTFLEISGKAMEEIEVAIPEDKNEQRQIAQILDAFDKKIENNLKLNDYLSAICEIIVSVTNSNNTMTLADISFQVTSRVSSSEVAIERYVSTESLLPNKGGRQTASSFPVAGKVTVYQPGDTLISNIRPYFKKIWYANCEGTCSSDVIVFRGNEKKLAPYLYSILRNDNFFEHVMAGAKGTKMPRGDKKQIMQYPVQSNCEERKLEFLTSLVNQIGVNTRENAKLSNLRNALLSKLITGEIDISKI